MADPHRPIHRVIVSVFDKKGLETLAEAFIAAGTEVVSTGSTALRLEELGRNVKSLLTWRKQRVSKPKELQ